MKPSSYKVGKDVVFFDYKVEKKLPNGRVTTDEISIMLNSNNKIERVSTRYYNDTILIIIADIMGISKSKLSTSKYRLYCFTGSITEATLNDKI